MLTRTHSERWPRTGDQVVIALRRTRLSAEVAYVTSQSVGLRVSYDQRALAPGADRRHPAALEWVEGDAAYRVPGELCGGEPTVGHRFVPRSRPLPFERREHMRAPVDATIVLSTDAGARLVGRTRNLSGGGALVGDLDRLPALDDRLRFSLVPRVGRDALHGRCRVTRVDDRGGVAVAFEGVSPRLAHDIAHFILGHRG